MMILFLLTSIVCRSYAFSPTYRVLDRWTVTKPLDLLERFSDIFSSRTQVRKAFEYGQLLLIRSNSTVVVETFDPNNTTMADVSLDEPLVPGDTILRITREPSDHMYPIELTNYVYPPINLPTVVYQDDHLAIVNKPAGMDTIGQQRHDLQSALPFVLYATSTVSTYLPRPVHRLDRRTCGLVLVAKSQSAMRALSRQFANRHVRKYYTAVVVGEITHQSGTIDYPIDGKAAVSDWRVLEQRNGWTLLQVQPHTGRTHQIRRHLSYCLGCPIAGDNKYDQGKWKQLRKRGLFLCSHAIQFRHPTTDAWMDWSIPIPPTFRALLDEKL